MLDHTTRPMIAAAALAAALLSAARAEDPAAAAWPVREQPDLKELCARAPNLAVETLDAPVRTVSRGGRYFAPNPDGRTHDLIQVYFKQYGGPNTLALMDLGAGTVKTVDTGARYANFHLAPGVIAPNGKLFLSILGGTRQELVVYDPAADALTLDAAPLPAGILGETHPLQLGPDGMVYAAGTHPSASVTAVRIDPDTLAVTSYGAIGPSHAPHPAWAYSMAVDATHMYIASGKTPWYLVALDLASGKAEVLHTNPAPDGYLEVNQNHGGASCFSRTKRPEGGHVDQRSWLHQGRMIPMEGDRPTPPWPEPPSPPARLPEPELSFIEASPNERGEAAIWYRTAEAKAAAPAGDRPAPALARDDEPPPPPPSAAEMEAAGWRALRYTVGMYPLKIDRLIELPDGRLMGTAGHYQGNFFHNPATGRSEHPGRCGLSHYSSVIHDGKVYMSGYPSGPVYVLDPSRPWTANKPLGTAGVVAENDPMSNPRRLLQLEKAGAKKMLAGAAANGTIYFGGVWMREGSWGGLGWVDAATGAADGIWKPLAAHQIRYMAGADEGRVLVLSTLPVDNPERGLIKDADAPLLFFDTRTNTLLPDRVAPIPGSRCTGPIVAVGGARVIGWTENPADPKGSSILYGVDAVARRVLFTKTLPYPIPIDVGGHQWDPWDFRLGPDGHIWTFINWKLARIDPADASITFLGSTGDGGRLAFSGGDVYLGGTEALRRVRGLYAP